MNTLLVYPRFPDTFWSLRYALSFLRKKALVPPLGLLTIASMLPKSWQCRLVDLNVDQLAQQDLDWADCVLLSAMDIQRDSAARVIERCRRANVPVIAGGPLFTSQPDAFPQVQHLVLNEAELTLPAFLDDFAAGRAQRIYRTTELADLSTTPVPRWDLARWGAYSMAGIQFSRGCPFDCEFCDVTALFGRRPRIKSTAQVLAELDSLLASGWRDAVLFVDDNLIGQRLAVKRDLLPALIQWQKRSGPIPFMTQASLNLADDPELMQLMRDAGFDTVFVGVETPSAASLTECHKTPNLRRDLVASIHRLQRAGLQVQAGFIVGFDSDGPDIFRRQVDFIQASGIVTAMVGMLQAFPGTRLHQRMQREGRLLGNPTGDNVDSSTNIVPAMGIQSLERGYRWLMRALYSPGGYYPRIRTFLRQYRRPNIELSMHHGRFAAFLRSIVRLGIIGQERWQYWKLLAWTLLHRPQMLSIAVSLAISGHHLRRIGEMHTSDRLAASASVDPAPAPAPSPTTPPATAADPDDLAKVLDRPIPALNFERVALTDFFDFLRDICGAGFIIDWRSLQDAGVPKAATLSLHTEPTTLGALLSQMNVPSTPGNPMIKLAVRLIDGKLVIYAGPMVFDTEPAPNLFRVRR